MEALTYPGSMGTLISKDFYFDAAHRLHTVASEHPCYVMHGHRYKVTFCLKQKLEGVMVMDYHNFAPIKKLLDEWFDHRLLIAAEDTQLQQVVKAAEASGANLFKVTVLPIKDITAECLADYFAHILTLSLENVKDLGDETHVCVTVQETPNTGASTVIPVGKVRGNYAKYGKAMLPQNGI